MSDAPNTAPPAAPVVLFVCTGNICRSPMAEALLRHSLPPGSRWRAQSAGLSAFPGDAASTGAIQALAEVGVDLRPHRSRPLAPELVSAAQVIVAMTRDHRDDILSRFPSAGQHTFLLRTFDPRAGDNRDISDPIGGTLAVYRRCRDMIAAAIPGLVEFLSELRLAR